MLVTDRLVYAQIVQPRIDVLGPGDRKGRARKRVRNVFGVSAASPILVDDLSGLCLSWQVPMKPARGYLCGDTGPRLLISGVVNAVGLEDSLTPADIS